MKTNTYFNDYTFAENYGTSAIEYVFAKAFNENKSMKDQKYNLEKLAQLSIASSLKHVEWFNKHLDQELPRDSAIADMCLRRSMLYETFNDMLQEHAEGIFSEEDLISYEEMTCGDVEELEKYCK